MGGGVSFRFEDLEVWKLAIKYDNEIFDTTKKFPKESLYELTSQLRKAALFISSNIAEGSGSVSKKDFANFLNIAIRSVFETVSQLKIAEARNYVTNREFKSLYNLTEKLVRKISALKNKLK